MEKKPPDFKVRVQELLEHIPHLKEELNAGEDFFQYRHALREGLARLQSILDKYPPDIELMAQECFGFFRTLTDSDFEKTLVGKDCLEFSNQLGNLVYEFKYRGQTSDF